MAQGLKQIVNGRILTSQGWLRGGSVIINGSTIVEVSKSECIPDEVTTVITFQFPVIQDLIKLRVSSKTGRIYNFVSSKANMHA